MRIVPSGVLALLLLAACDSSSVDPPPTLDTTGSVVGTAYLDVDGSESLTGTDEPARGMRVRVRSPNSGLELASGTTGSNGEFLISDIPVGSIEVDVDPASLGDSLLAVPRDSAPLTLGAGDPLWVPLGVTFPQLSVAEAREAEEGTTIFTQGLVLNRLGFAPGGAIHVESDAAAIRVLVPANVSVSVFPGDSVRVLARPRTDLGQPALGDARIFPMAPDVRDAVPLGVTAIQARNAGGGELDADLVELTDGEVTEFRSVVEGFLMTVTDASGAVDVRLRTEQGFFQGGVLEGSPVVFVRGLLVHDPVNGAWDLVPRTTQDIRLEFPDSGQPEKGG